jgi:class 3 adenylate cyclase
VVVRKEAVVAVDSIELGRAAFARHSWPEAVEALRSAGRETPLAAADLERLAEAEWWAGHADEAIDAYERAATRYAEDGQRALAAGVALRLAYLAFRRQAGPVAAGWLGRAGELLATEPESGTHAWLGVFEIVGALMGGRLDEAVAQADVAMDIARRHGNADAHALALSFKGMALVMQGRWQEGVALADQAAAAALSGDLDLRIASDIWCNTITTCRNTGDTKRAGQWTDEAERWMRREGVSGYPGTCQVHRAELKMLRGDWRAAEEEALGACEELERHGLLDDLGWAHYEVGEVRMRMGDLTTATSELDRAYEYGHDAQPASALVQLSNGSVAEAARAIDQALDSHPGSGGPMGIVGRAWLLPAQVEIALSRGDVATARSATEELERTSSGFQSEMFTAAALSARGALLLHEGQATEALPVLDRAWREWLRAGLPYEGARTRTRYAQALAAVGDAQGARRDLRAARAVFERLGATLDVPRVDRLLAALEPDPSSSPQRAARTFMFTDIVTSTDLIGLIGDAAWEDLLSWHDRELRAQIGLHQGEEVNHTGDGFFVAFEQATSAIECAVDIQRSLARHRHEHGFAPGVRIGLHAGEATRHGANYSGSGVHIAARIGAAATGEQILVSDAVVEQAGGVGYPLSSPRSISLKGVREPVMVRDVVWR